MTSLFAHLPIRTIHRGCFEPEFQLPAAVMQFQPDVGHCNQHMGYANPCMFLGVVHG